MGRGTHNKAEIISHEPVKVKATCLVRGEEKPRHGETGGGERLYLSKGGWGSPSERRTAEDLFGKRPGGGEDLNKKEEGEEKGTNIILRKNRGKGRRRKGEKKTHERRKNFGGGLARKRKGLNVHELGGGGGVGGGRRKKASMPKEKKGVPFGEKGGH